MVVLVFVSGEDAEDAHANHVGEGVVDKVGIARIVECPGVDYTFGLSANPVLRRQSAALLAAAVRGWEETHTPQRLFTGFEYQAESCPVPRWVIVKAEAHAPGTNRRFVVTNRPEGVGVSGGDV